MAENFYFECIAIRYKFYQSAGKTGVSDMATLERAIRIAAGAHQGHQDKSGLPYILHPLRIMVCMESVENMIIATLHDVIEDSEWTLDDLRKEGFSEPVVGAVDSLSRREDETFENYIKRLKGNPAAIPVKLEDLKDNMNMLRLKTLKGRDWKRLQRYHWAFNYLTSEE
jgi:(p)ppGpp synthase/HD superfamily hydrolase